MSVHSFIIPFIHQSINSPIHQSVFPVICPYRTPIHTFPSQLLAGAHVDSVTPQKQTALHLAAEKDHSIIVSLLLENKAQYDRVDDSLNNGQYILCFVVAFAVVVYVAVVCWWPW